MIATLSPFMTYMFAPGGGILTMGSSDAILPFVLGALVATAVLAPADRKTPVRLSFASSLLILAMLVAAASVTIWTVVDPSFLTSRAIADSIKLGIGIVYFIVVYRLGINAGWEGCLRALRFWAWTATILSFGSLVGATGAIVLVPTDGFRSNGFFEDPNLYAGYLLVSLSIVLFLGVLKDIRWLPLQSLMIVGGLVTTGSRAGMGSLVLLLLLAAIIINSARLRLTILGMTSIGSLLLVWLIAQGDRQTSILGLDRLVSSSANVDDDPRLRLWGVAIQKWLDEPVWGIGLGQFERFSVNAGGRLRSTGLGYVTHNTFLFFLVSFGVIGLGLFLAMLTWLSVRLYSAPGLSRNAKHALMSGIVVLCSQFMTLNLQNLRYVWIYFGMVLAVSVLAARADEGEPGAEPAVETDQLEVARR